jgi:hypothetical protein
MTVEIRAIDTHDGLLSEMFAEPYGLFVSLDDLLAFIDQTAASVADNPDLNEATPAQTLATLAQLLATNFNVVSS